MPTTESSILHLFDCKTLYRASHRITHSSPGSPPHHAFSARPTQLPVQIKLSPHSPPRLYDRSARQHTIRSHDFVVLLRFNHKGTKRGCSECSNRYRLGLSIPRTRLAGCGKTRVNETEAPHLRSHELSMLIREGGTVHPEGPLWATRQVEAPCRLMSRPPRAYASAPSCRRLPRR